MESQADHIINETEKQESESKLSSRVNDENSPQVVFPSINYPLTREQEDRLVEHALKRVDQLESELGRNINPLDESVGDTKSLWSSWHDSFMGKRERYEAMYNGRVQWRERALGGIFQRSNLNMPISRRVARQMTARANNYFFATDPFFASFPEGIEDELAGEVIEKYLKYKARESKLKRNLERATENAFVRGEAVMKIYARREENIYQQLANVAVDENGEPLVTTKGDYIFDSDAWTVNEEHQVEVLEKDMDIQKPENLIFIEKVVTRRLLEFDGAEAKEIHYKDFLCPLNAESIEKADCVAHIYDVGLMDMIDQYSKNRIQTKDEAERFLQLVDMLRHNQGNTKHEAGKDIDNIHSTGEGESGNGEDDKDIDPLVNCVEVCIRFDANQDGIMEDILMVIDRTNKYPIFYDYVANSTTTGFRPYKVIKTNEIDDRWYGLGAMELFDSSQMVIDLMINRWNFSQGSSGRVTFWNPQNTLEGQANPHLKLNSGKTYTLANNKKADDCLEYVSLPETKGEDLTSLMEFFMQSTMNESGVQNTNDANMTGMDSTKLATGIRNIEKSGQEMFSIYLSHIERGVEDVINVFTKTVLSVAKPAEVFHYFNGKGMEVLTFNGENARSLNVHVRVLLTRYKGEQMIAQSQVAKEAVAEFYAFDPAVQAIIAPFFRNIIKATDIGVNEDDVIQPIAMLTEGGNIPNDAPASVTPIQQGRAENNL